MPETPTSHSLEIAKLVDEINPDLRQLHFGAAAYCRGEVPDWQIRTISGLAERTETTISPEDELESLVQVCGGGETGKAKLLQLARVVAKENDGQVDSFATVAALVFPDNDPYRHALVEIMLGEGWRALYGNNEIPMLLSPAERAELEAKIGERFLIIPPYEDEGGISIINLFYQSLLARSLELMAWLKQKPGAGQDLWQEYRQAVASGKIPVADFKWEEREEEAEPQEEKLLPKLKILPDKYEGNQWVRKAVLVTETGGLVNIAPDQPELPSPHEEARARYGRLALILKGNRQADLVLGDQGKKLGQFPEINNPMSYYFLLDLGRETKHNEITEQLKVLATAASANEPAPMLAALEKLDAKWNQAGLVESMEEDGFFVCAGERIYFVTILQDTLYEIKICWLASLREHFENSRDYPPQEIFSDLCAITSVLTNAWLGAKPAATEPVSEPEEKPKEEKPKQAIDLTDFRL